jgi:hypothetical protein
MKRARVRSAPGPARGVDLVLQVLEEHNREQRRYFDAADHRTLQQVGRRTRGATSIG